MNKLIVAILFILLSGTNLKSQVIHEVIQKYFSLHNNFKNESDVWGNYTLDLTIESIIHYSRISEVTRYQDDINNFFSKRNYQFSDTISYRKTPFAHVYFAYYLTKRDSSFIKPFVYESKLIMNMVFKLSSMP
jgi:hypothetical protein